MRPLEILALRTFPEVHPLHSPFEEVNLSRNLSTPILKNPLLLSTAECVLKVGQQINPSAPVSHTI